MFKERTTKPKNNKYYIRIPNGGYNGAIKGKPTDPEADVLCNCVGYANGRFAEIQGLGKIKYQLICNAENFIEQAKNYGLKISDKPTLGGIMVWQKGNSLNVGDGAGHVAIVEKIISSNTILTSESGYNYKPFYMKTRTNDNGRWSQSSTYKFRGCIVNPAVKETKTEVEKVNIELSVLKKSSKGEEVKTLQRLLNAIQNAKLTVDGSFGSATEKAVKAFQKTNKLTQDGIVGAKTWEALLK